MQFQIRIQPSERLALRDPENTQLGRNIVRQGLLPDVLRVDLGRGGGA